MHRLIIYFGLIFFSHFAFSALTFIDSSLEQNTSNYTLNGTTLVIYGGTAGGDTGGDCPSTSGTCNSCIDGGRGDCNFKRISPGQVLNLQFTSSENISGQGFIKNADGVVASVTTTIFSAGSTVTINSVTWGDLCSKIISGNSNTDCSGSGTGTFSIGIQSSVDTNTTDQVDFTVHIVPAATASAGCSPNDLGLAQFTAFPGDEKVYFPQSTNPGVTEPLEFCSTGPTTTGQAYDALVAFYSEESLADVDVESESVEINLTGTFGSTDDSTLQVDEAFIDGLTNEKPYFTRLAIQDLAGNIFSLLPSEENPSNCISNISKDSATDDIFNCPYSTLPLAVAGLLEDDVNCFIATATYGSSMDKKVKDFRKFRSEVLLKSEWGTWLVRKYYKWGSYLSVYIAHSPTLKLISRTLLYPVWLFTIISLKFGFLFSFFAFSLVFFSLIFGLFYFTNKQRRISA